jgi:membrane protease YdiL (CAAX protease family)
MLSEKPWQPEAVWRMVMANFATLFLGMLAAGILTRLLGGWSRSDLEMVHFALVAASFQGATFVLATLLCRSQYVTWNAAFGISNQPLRALSIASVVAVGTLIGAMILGAVASAVMLQLGMKPEAQQAVQMLQATESIWRRAIYGVVAILVAPAAEEILFRGLVYPTIKQMGFPRLALWGTSLIFAATHVNAMALVPLTFVALMFTLLYEKTNNLLAPILAPSMFNAVNFAILIFQKDLTSILDSLYERI